jgi:hypothetical protein
MIMLLDFLLHWSLLVGFETESHMCANPCIALRLNPDLGSPCCMTCTIILEAAHTSAKPLGHCLQPISQCYHTPGCH